MLPSLFDSALLKIVGKANLLADEASCWTYGYDNSQQHHLPDVVVFPENTAQIVQIVLLCREHKIPLTTRGRGTATTGAAVPVQGGLLLAMERMNRIISIDPPNRFAIVEPGVTNETLQLAVKKEGLFWAPDPSSQAFCSIGGNIAVNAAGPRAVKYGSTRENILGLTTVTGAGKILQTGTYTTKSAIGYDLTRLITGSEGTLAIVTQAILKLLPLPTSTGLAVIDFENIESATNAIGDIMQQQQPCALEFMDARAIELIRHYGQLSLPQKTKALLFCAFDGSPVEVEFQMKLLQKITEQHNRIQIKIAYTAHEIKALWKIRKALSPTLKHVAPHKINEDIVVPLQNMAPLLRNLMDFKEKSSIDIVTFGHAGNGNLHVNILYDKNITKQQADAEKCLAYLFKIVHHYRGAISGEHGIGLLKREFLKESLDEYALTLMQQIKKQFDPDLILNPEKIF